MAALPKLIDGLMENKSIESNGNAYYKGRSHALPLNYFTPFADLQFRLRDIIRPAES